MAELAAEFASSGVNSKVIRDTLPYQKSYKAKPRISKSEFAASGRKRDEKFNIKA